MNKLKHVVKILKFVLMVAVHILKFIAFQIPHLFQELFRLINKRLRVSITFKTTATYALFFTIILLILGILFTCGFGFFLTYQSNQWLAMNSLVISNSISESTDIPTNQIKKFAEIENIYVTLFDDQMNPIYTTSDKSLPENSSLRIRLSPTTSIGEYLHYETPVKLNYGISKIEVSKDLTNEIAYLAALVSAIATSFLLAIILTIIIGSRATRKMLKPIDNMTRTARSISAGDLNTRLDVVDSHDELKELAETFNEMLDRIQTSFDKQDVFVSDASHELRTPISVIQGYANLLQRWGKEDKAVLQESIDAIKSESDYMKELVEKLLFLASADKKNQRLYTSPLALHELIDEVLRETSMIDTQHNISLDINDNIMVNGERGLIKQALRIFIDNSIKYTPAGGSITLNSRLSGKKAFIIIKDTGIGIPKEDLPYIFDRFYKSDKSRTRESGGVGLGLSIAKWIIDQHHGDILVESTPHQGTRILVTLPAIDIPV